ncbi:L-threonylcarbamoyladenylate synthase [Desulfobotulus sp.]|jgi:tRNA threonylcarbamoyl adenosine modification protein (Sua5/YciO/YrdC/YwlC family)|uniref:L-threonylcarbamoyladenylate synthase n=1 Tax=Desulfobotulus sp. TaxID=1940337 RepID=UPI002A35B5E2|nr:L-threonylcarbamoyladenylate synthase [Desulfobotulus sp.]MDY0162184.1 L-threonylcarbamoyladenylate synthase [Desulfobotulus sp.]
MLITIHPQTPQPRQIRQVVECLKDGGVIIYPTDTHYGIGCDIQNKKAIERIYQIKQKEKKEPFSFICPDLTDISRYAKVHNTAYRILKRLLPGPYTFILEGTREVPRMMLTKRKTAGIRVPDHAIAQAIVRELGNPVISATASRPGETVETHPSLLYEIFGSQVDMVIDGGPVPGEPSSIIDLSGETPEVLREGLGKVQEFL